MVNATEKAHEETGRTELGRKAILAQDPHDGPEHLERTPAPRFHARDGKPHRGMEEAYGGW